MTRFNILLSTLVARIASGDKDREGGQGLAEYALILALIAIVSVVALAFVGESLVAILNSVGEGLGGTIPPA